MTKPVTQVLLTLAKPLQDEIVTESGIRFYFDSSYNKAWGATVVATIAALPENPHPKYSKILAQLKVGDEVAVSYQICGNITFKGDAGQFMQTTEDNPHLKEFVNSYGYWVKMYALPKRSGIIGHVWVGVYTDNRMNIIDGVQGTEEEIYRWMAQFPFGKTDIYTFDNYFEHEGKDYWKCEPDDIFAKKNKGHLVAIGDRIICKPVEEVVPEQFLIDAHKGQTVKLRYQDRGKILSGGKSKGLKKEDVISFDPTHLERYEFWGKNYYLINENLVLGKWN